LFKPSLTPTQLPESSERIADHGRTRRFEAAHGSGELVLRLFPPTLPAEHARVVRPADVEQEDVVLIAEVANAAAPLGRSLVVPHPLTCGNHVATGPGHAVEKPGLALECDGRRLIKAAHPLLQVAFADQSTSLEPEAEHLDLRRAEHATKLDCEGREPSRLGRVLVQGDRDVPLMDREPAVVDSGLEVVDQAVSTLEPAVGDRRLPAKEQAVSSQEGGDARCGAPVTAVDVETVRLFPGIEGEPLVVEHAPGPAQPFVRLRALDLRQALLEERLCTIPLSAAERSPA